MRGRRRGRSLADMTDTALRLLVWARAEDGAVRVCALLPAAAAVKLLEGGR
jgi:hypothetical protein